MPAPDVSLMLVMAIWTNDGSAINVGWSKPTINDDKTPITSTLTYDVYRSHNNGPYVLTPHRGVVARKVSITAGIFFGIPDCFKIVAIENGIQSAMSSPDCAKVVK